MADTSANARIAIYSKLSNDAVLASLVDTRIYAGIAPQNETFPYVIIGDRVTDQRFKTKDAIIQSHKIRIYAYSRKNSPVEIENIKAAIFNTLEKQELTTTASFIDCMQDGIDDVNLESDGRTYRAIIEFLITMQ